jgi:hypothetical protein
MEILIDSAIAFSLQESALSTTVALLAPVVTAVVGSDIAGLGLDVVVSTKTTTI